MKPKHAHWFLLGGALTFLVVVLATARPWSQKTSSPPISPLVVIPAGAAFVMDIDLARLRKSAAGRELARLGFEKLASASGAFQPLRDVDELVIAVPGNARFARERPRAFEPDALVVVASGRFRGKAAADAAVERIRARRGDPVRTTLGSFESVRDLDATGEVAARDGLVVVGDGAYLRAVLAAAEGHRADGDETERTRDRVHVELRRTFGRGAAVTATLTLPDGWLEAALGDAEVRRSPLSLVRSAAFRVNVGETLDLDALALCVTADDCGRFRQFVVDLKSDVERALGASAPLRRFEIGAPGGQRVELSFSLPLRDALRYLAPADAGD